MFDVVNRPVKRACTARKIGPLVLGIALTALAGPAGAAGSGHCSEGEKDWFTAAVAGDEKVVSLCGSNSLEGNAAWLQYRFGEPGHIELRYPDKPAGSTAAFTVRVYTRARVSLSKLEFGKGGYTYAILDDFSDELDGPQDHLSLRVKRDSSGETVASFDLVRKSEGDGILQFMNTLPTEPYDE